MLGVRILDIRSLQGQPSVALTRLQIGKGNLVTGRAPCVREHSTGWGMGEIVCQPDLGPTTAIGSDAQPVLEKADAGIGLV